tara:strand:+ start:112 stop:336 length:225 start_codon:yes stop_codon:yes gene_type:complete
MLNEFKDIKIKSKSEKWKFGDGKKVKILKYSNLSDNEKILKFSKWIAKPDKSNYMSENLFNFYLNNRKLNNSIS